MDLMEGHIAIDPPRGVLVWDIDPYEMPAQPAAGE
jgi:hypothetical protein